MLRLLGPTDLEGYVFRTPGGPRCELLAGIVIRMSPMPDGTAVSIRGQNIENGQPVCRTATVMFQNRGADRKMLQTRLIAAGICNGMFISVLSMQRNSQRIAMDFKTVGLWRLKGYRGEQNVLIGKAVDTYVQKDIVSFRLLEYDQARHRYYRRTVDITDPGLLKKAAIDFSSVNGRACVCLCGPETRCGSSMSVYKCRQYELLRVSLGRPDVG